MSFNSPSNNESKGTRRPYDEQCLCPVTIKMIRQASSSMGGQLTLADGRELSTIKFVGAVRSVDEQSTHVRYDIEDGTGLVTVQQYIDDATESNFTREMRQATTSTDHCYVRVVGQVKEYNDQKNVVGFSVRLLSSGNELAHHMLEVVYAGERYKKKSGGGVQSSNMYGTNMSLSSPKPQRLDYNNNSSTVPQHQQQHSLYDGGSGGGGGGGDETLHNAVLNFIRVEGDKMDVGADINDCIQSLKGTFSEKQVRESTSHLSSEGHIYSTINETKFKYAM